jgi:hypothetical protein
VRLHAEWSEQGLSLWLGVDQDCGVPLEQLTGALLVELHRWLADRGGRLLELVCNGKIIWKAPASGSASAPGSREDGAESSPSIRRWAGVSIRGPREEP